MKKISGTKIALMISLILLVAIPVAFGISYGLTFYKAKKWKKCLQVLPQADKVSISGRFGVSGKVVYLKTELIQRNHIKLLSDNLASLSTYIDHRDTSHRRCGAVCACAVAGSFSVYKGKQEYTFHFNGHGFLGPWMTSLRVDYFRPQMIFHDSLVENGVVFEDIK